MPTYQSPTTEVYATIWRLSHITSYITFISRPTTNYLSSREWNGSWLVHRRYKCDTLGSKREAESDSEGQCYWQLILRVILL